MSDVIIKKPILIEIDTVETDSYLPSFRVNIRLEMNHPTGYFSYQANDIWFDCSEWDMFLNQLNSVDFKNNFNFKLSDISEYFNLTFAKNISEEIIFKVSIRELFSGENGEGYIGYQGKLSNDLMFEIKNNFESLDKWW